MAGPFTVTDNSFQQEVLDSETLTLVDFWAGWCGPCKMIAPVVEEIAAEQGDALRLVKMDVDSNPETPGRYGIMGIPTLILFKNGEEVTRVVGYRPKDALLEALVPYME